MNATNLSCVAVLPVAILTWAPLRGPQNPTKPKAGVPEKHDVASASTVFAVTITLGADASTETLRSSAFMIGAQEDELYLVTPNDRIRGVTSSTKPLILVEHVGIADGKPSPAIVVDHYDEHRNLALVRIRNPFQPAGGKEATPPLDILDWPEETVSDALVLIGPSKESYRLEPSARKFEDGIMRLPNPTGANCSGWGVENASHKVIAFVADDKGAELEALDIRVVIGHCRRFLPKEVSLLTTPCGWYGEVMPRGITKGKTKPDYIWSKDAAPMVFVSAVELPVAGASAARFAVNAFYCDKYETSVAMFKQFVDETHYLTEAERRVPRGGIDVTPLARANWRDPEAGYAAFAPVKKPTDDLPVQFLSWEDANRYCSWAGKRLMSELEWEAAALWNPTSSRKQLYTWGDRWPPGKLVANLADSSGRRYRGEQMPYIANYTDGYGLAAPVTAFEIGASPAGALNLIGNVAEWTSTSMLDSVYIPEPVKADMKRRSASGPDAVFTNRYVVCGGSYMSSDFIKPGDLSLHDTTPGSMPSDALGFRCVVSLPIIK